MAPRFRLFLNVLRKRGERETTLLEYDLGERDTSEEEMIDWLVNLLQKEKLGAGTEEMRSLGRYTQEVGENLELMIKDGKTYAKGHCLEEELTQEDIEEVKKGKYVPWHLKTKLGIAD
jgi:hypothetical protein